MEQRLAEVLGNTQSPNANLRNSAEEALLSLYTDKTFPLCLANISSATTHPLPLRQAALLCLKNLILAGWSAQLDEFKGQVLVDEDVKTTIRDALLNLAISDSVESKIQNAASFVVAKIASADYPHDWQGLVPTLLHILPQATDNRSRGILKVLLELVQDGFNEEQFFGIAQDLLGALYIVATDNHRPAALRALAVSILRSCFDTLETIMEMHKAAVKTFAERALGQWLSFFSDVLKTRLPLDIEVDGALRSEDTYEHRKGVIALKLQVVKVLMKMRSVFPALLMPHVPTLFTAIWEELNALWPYYEATYINVETESHLENTDGLPYTVDFLVLEDVDFMQACLRSSSVRKELEHGREHNSSWLFDIMKLAISYAQITAEEQSIWTFDVNIFLAEETGITANYTARTACGDLVMKLSEWYRATTFEVLTSHIRELLSDPGSSWQSKESVLYLLQQILLDWIEVGSAADPNATLEILDQVQSSFQTQYDLFRARGYLLAAILVQMSNSVMLTNAGYCFEATLKSVTQDKSEVVQTSCIKAIQQYLQARSPERTAAVQEPIIAALLQWTCSRDMGDFSDSDDLMTTTIETLRDAISLDAGAVLQGQALDLLFNIASYGAANFQITAIVNETFEDICSTVAALGGDAYTQLCSRVLPSLTGAFDIGNTTGEVPLTVLAAEMLSQLAKHGCEPLPSGFTQATLPRLQRILLGAGEEELLKASTSAVKYILKHDYRQVFEWHDEAGKSGLEVVLIIIDRLLGPSIEDNAAAEVGGLAAESVEKAGADRLGPYLMHLLQAVAVRLTSATQAHLIQSLISIFARLSVISSAEVVEFLSQVRIEGDSALQVVIAKWLENSVNFMGYEDIGQNVIALSKLYLLYETRLASVMVKGDLIVTTSDCIMTRSKARQNPDQYTLIPAPIKIIKILVEELSVHGEVSHLDRLGASGSIREALEDGEEEVSTDDEWEDESNDLDMFGASKEQLMAFANETPGSQRGHNDETQRYLVDFFQGVTCEPSFCSVFDSLTTSEQAKLRTLSPWK